MNVILCGSLAAVCMTAPALAQPQRFAFVLDAPAGSVQLTTSIGVSSHGFWIGNHDPVTNPGGTRTIPGLFGGTIDLAAHGVLGCYADCDQSTGVGPLDIFDFLCFQNAFVAGNATACACDVSSGPLVCDIFDFLCFQNAFVAGCP